MQITLASKSPRRKELLRQILLDFNIKTCETEEDYDESLEPHEIVEFLARKKAKAVADTLSSGIVLGADTIVEFNGRILHKPQDEEDAYQTLKLLSGQTHHVYTGVAMLDLDGGREYISYGQTEVTFKELTEDEIRLYINTKEPMDKAGSYGIQGLGGVFVRELKGDYFNVVGLPIERVYDGLKELNINIKQYMTISDTLD